MGKWIALLKARTAYPLTESTDETDETPAGWVLSVLSVGAGRGPANSSAIEPGMDLAPAQATPWHMAGAIRLPDTRALARRLHLRDCHTDDRVVYIECSNLAGHDSTGWRCQSPRAAGVGADLPAVTVTTLQRCAGFRAATE